jgi:S1-C subfamily serine protease
MGSPALVADPLALHVAVTARRAVGSAFWLEPGVLVTAAHLVRDMSPGDRIMLRADPAGGMAGEATLIAVSREIDLALLRPPPGFRPPSPPGDAAVATGLSVSAAGSLPMRGPSAPAARRRIDGMITGGPISIPGLGSGPIVRLSGIAPGFSGGPVLDAHGRLVGMIVAVRPQPQTATESAFRPRRPVSAAGAEEAFVLSAAVLRAEARRLLSANPVVLQ